MDLYEVLEVDKSASKEEIKKAYWGKAKNYHPDNADGKGDPKKFNLISTAYSVLSDNEKRKRYNETGSYSNKSDKTEDIECQAYRDLAKIFSDAIESLIKQNENFTVDVILQISSLIKSNINELEEKKIATDREKQRLNKIASKFKYKGNSVNLANEIIIKRLASSERFLVNIQEKLTLCKKILEILKDYEFMKDENQGFNVLDRRINKMNTRDTVPSLDAVAYFWKNFEKF